MITQSVYPINPPNLQGDFDIVNEPYWSKSSCSLRTSLVQVELVTVFALRFQNLPARNSSWKIFKHEKEEKLAGPKGKLAGPAQFLVAEGLGPLLNAKTVVNMRSQQGLHFDPPNLQDGFCIALSQMVLQMSHINRSKYLCLLMTQLVPDEEKKKN